MLFVSHTSVAFKSVAIFYTSSDSLVDCFPSELFNLAH